MTPELIDDVRQVIINFFESYTLVAVAQHGLGSFVVQEPTGDKIIYDLLEEFTLEKFITHIKSRLEEDADKIAPNHMLDIHRCGTQLLEQTIEEYMAKYRKNV